MKVSSVSFETIFLKGRIRKNTRFKDISVTRSRCIVSIYFLWQTYRKLDELSEKKYTQRKMHANFMIYFNFNVENQNLKVSARSFFAEIFFKGSLKHAQKHAKKCRMEHLLHLNTKMLLSLLTFGNVSM